MLPSDDVMNPQRYLLLALAILAGNGCGPSGPAIVPVFGVVTLDNAPVAGANVMFAPIAGGRPAEGVTDSTGKFMLTTQTDKATAGAMEGTYLVTVIGVRSVGAKAGDDGTSADVSQVREEWFLPKKYSKRETSALQQTVTKGMPSVELKLSAK